MKFFEFNLIFSGFLLLFYIVLRKKVLAALAYLLLGLVLGMKLLHCFNLNDIFNCIAISFFIFFLILISLAVLKHENKIFKTFSLQILIAIWIYLFFSFTSKSFLIKMVAEHTAFLGSLFGFKINNVDGIINANGYELRMLFECTAIEGLSIFSGAILGLGPGRLNFKKIIAFSLLLIFIYVMNLFRNLIVCLICGYLLFGDNSFFVAHNVIAKFFSLLVVFVVAYLCFRIFPEL
ncbi:archaeosortase A, partial [Candidatus Bathyarchaeota archaeon]